jgi:RNA 2',3'-cyclic 3'-phosphodiesterase
MKRVFIAIKTDAEAELLRMISSSKALLASERIKWVDPANIHLTLAFLGYTEEKRIKILGTMLKEKCAGFHDFEFVLAGAGVFKNYRDPKVIWAGIRSSDRLSELNNAIASGLKEEDFNVEVRPFRPHLTIGRIRSITDAENLKNVLARYKETEFQTVPVKEVILFESILMQTGPLYKPLGKFNLG